MEAAGHRHDWLIIGAPSVRIVLLLCMSIPAVTLSPKPVGPTCQDGEFQTEDKICCNKCPAGYKLVENCRATGLRSNCTRCPAGQYTDQINFFPNCMSCKTCKRRNFEIEESTCKYNKNTICGCRHGYYKSVIDSVTFECRPCTTCGDNQKEVEKCSSVSDTVCECKDNYYKVKKMCLPCTNCTSECFSHCPVTKPTKESPNITSFLINVIAVVVVAVVLTLVLVVIVTHIATKRQTKRKLLSSQHCDQSTTIYKELPVHSEETSDHSLQSVHQHIVINQESLNLPDCVPLEIKIPEVIYSVLDLVPVLQMKQLVRSLGVTDTVIERAELDHRSSREAHYQMLRAWAEKGTHMCRGGQGGVLHLPLLHELLDKLRQMHLEQTAEELETKYNLL